MIMRELGVIYNDLVRPVVRVCTRPLTTIGEGVNDLKDYNENGYFKVIVPALYAIIPTGIYSQSLQGEDPSSLFLIPAVMCGFDLATIAWKYGVKRVKKQDEDNLSEARELVSNISPDLEEELLRYAGKVDDTESSDIPLSNERVRE